MRSRAGWVVALGAIAASACSPVYDWRTVQLAGGGVSALMPCKPDVQTRKLKVADVPLHMTLQVCTAGDQTWAITSADVSDATHVAALLRALQAAAAANLATETAPLVPFAVPGATPSAASGRMALGGRLPDGRPMNGQMLFFSKGTRVYQASVLGVVLPAEGVENFLASLNAAH